MNEDLDISQLRRWVRGELPPAERREVGRWLMRSADPHLMDILYGLTREFEEEKANAAFLQRFPERAYVVSLWNAFWEAGAAVLSPVRGPAVPVGATLSGAGQASGVMFRSDPPDVVVDVVVAAGPRQVSLLATTDSGDEHLLFGPERCERGPTLEAARWRVEPEDGRVIFWLCEAPLGADQESLRSLELAARMDAVVVHASRWIEDPEVG